MDPALIFRIILGFPFVYLISGFPLARLFLSKEKTWSLKLFLTSFAFSLFLTYPAAVLMTILEGQSAQAIYSVHLPHSFISLFLVSLPFLIILFRKQLPTLSFPKINKYSLMVVVCIILYTFFVIYDLDRADILGDDYDLGYQAYNLHDGILAARKAFIISFNTHPPLMMTIKHFGMQLFSPWGLDTLSDWMYRGVEGMMGIGIILATYLLVRDFFSQKAALISALLLTVNNYMIFFGRYFEREIYLTLFLVISLYFFLNKRFGLAAFFLGCGFLVKASAVTLLPVYLLILWADKQKIFRILIILFLIYLPVTIYNLGAYITTGYMDSNFSQVFGLIHPFATSIPQNSIFVNLPSIFFLLADLYSWPVFVFLIFGTILVFYKKLYSNPLIKALFLWLVSSLVFFLFTPIRGYYLLFLTIPLVIMTGTAIVKIKWATLPVTGLLLFSAIYSFSGSSKVAQAFQPDSGWKKLKLELTRIYKPGDCLIKGHHVNDLAMRAYFQTDDEVKKALLGPNYLHYYKMCDEAANPVERIEIFYNLQGKVDYKIL